MGDADCQLNILVVQLLMNKWAPDMSRDMLAHWLDLMNQQGWIAREQVGCLSPCVHDGGDGRGAGQGGSDTSNRAALQGNRWATFPHVCMMGGMAKGAGQGGSDTGNRAALQGNTWASIYCMHVHEVQTDYPTVQADMCQAAW